MSSANVPVQLSSSPHESAEQSQFRLASSVASPAMTIYFSEEPNFRFRTALAPGGSVEIDPPHVSGALRSPGCGVVHPAFFRVHRASNIGLAGDPRQP